MDPVNFLSEIQNGDKKIAARIVIDFGDIKKFH